MIEGKHKCQLNLRQNEMLFYSGENSCMKFFGYLGLLFKISDKNPNCKKYIRSRAYIIYEKRRHFRYYNWRVHPFSLFSLYWNFYMVLTTVIGLIYIPYHAAFKHAHKDFWHWVKNFFLVCSLCDIFINFNTGYLDLSENFVELKYYCIIQQYVNHGTFVPDLLGSIPTDWFFIGHWQDLAMLRELASLTFVSRIFSTSKYLRNLAQTYDMSSHTYEFLATIFWLLLLLHWQSCLYWIIPLATVSLSQPIRPKNESWINILNLWHPSKEDYRYYHSFYRSVVTFTRSGFSKAEPITSEDQYTAIVLQLICTFAYCILIANMLQFFKGVNSSKLKYQLNSTRLNEYMQHKQLPLYVQRRFNTYFDFKFGKHYFKESEILSNFTDQMKQEVRMYTCRTLVENVVFFHDLPLSMLVRIVTLLKSEIFLTNDVIVMANQIGDCMYFIATGTVAVYTSSGKEVCHLENGAHFGEIALVMPDARRVATVVAVEVCKLYRLERADFIRTIHPYPLLWERIKKIAYERTERTAMLNVQ